MATEATQNETNTQNTRAPARQNTPAPARQNTPAAAKHNTNSAAKHNTNSAAEQNIDSAAERNASNGAIQGIPLGDYVVDPGRPLPELSSIGAQAFSAQSLSAQSLSAQALSAGKGEAGSRDDVFALIADHKLSPRMDFVSFLEKSPRADIINPLDWGMVRGPNTDHPVFAAIFKRPKGGRALATGDKEFTPIRGEHLTQTYIKPILNALKAVAASRLTYRALRPDNLFFADSERQKLVLGESFMSPPGFSQPHMFETIINAVCLPYGRSTGYTADDLYALGVTILSLYLGHRPGRDMSHSDLAILRAERGSYAALVGKEHLPNDMVTLLQGLLADDLDQRWDIESTQAWINSEKKLKKRVLSPKKTLWPLLLHDREYASSRSLTQGIFDNWDACKPIIKTLDIENWLARTLDSVEQSDECHILMTRYDVSIRENSDVFLSEVCMVLDPEGPVRFRDLVFMPDNLGGVVASIYGDKKQEEVFRGLVNSEILPRWVAQNGLATTTSIDVNKTIHQIRFYLRKTTYGYGFARCLYALNPDMACLSPLLKDHSVTKLDDVLKALDEIAAKTKNPASSPMDKHITAFIAAHGSDELNSHLGALSSKKDPEERILATVRILAFTQRKTNADPAPHLAEWLADFMQPLIARYHNRRRQEILGNRLTKATKTGNLEAMLHVVDNPDERERDAKGYAAAVEECLAVESEINHLQERLHPDNEEMMTVGHRAAALCLSVISSLIIGFSIIVF